MEEKKSKEKSAIIVFQDNEVRRTWHQGEWWFSVVDIVAVLTDSSDPKQYIKKMRQRDPILSINWGTICTPLELIAPDGKKRKSNCVNTKGALRLVQSIPSKKAEPFKQWLSAIGHERLQEMENPELAQDRAKKYYELKGYPKEWIDKRLRGIAIRQELTEEWRTRGVEEQKDFAILTNEISKATFGKTVGEYKQFKGLQRPNQNLRDHMNDWELILNMIGEKATTDITIAKDAQGFPGLKQTAQEGGDIAKNTRQELEKKIGKSLVSNDNYLHLNDKKKLKNNNF
tara:strand:+ start:1154 stop:2011 length:858 start_codon:yes stop_codon:yes gene_type:complete